MKDIKVIALTQTGQQLAYRLVKALQQSGKVASVCFKPQPFTQHVQALFNAGHPLVFITAMGIAVRSLAAVITSKHQDPAVLVMDERAEFVIPNLSRHEGGANNLAQEVSGLLNAQVVMTTAKTYVSPVYTVGMGCEKGCTAEHLNELLLQCLTQASLTMGDIQNINSIDIKAQEQGLITLSASKDKPYHTYSAKQLSVVEDLLSTKSDYIYTITGVYGVAESAALFAAQRITGDTAELVINKQKTDKATCAIARSYPKSERHQ
jgi:cobalt-precorrin 5A hydrolase